MASHSEVLRNTDPEHSHFEEGSIVVNVVNIYSERRRGVVVPICEMKIFSQVELFVNNR